MARTTRATTAATLNTMADPLRLIRAKNNREPRGSQLSKSDVSKSDGMRMPVSGGMR
jgi:hypothetical protein